MKIRAEVQIPKKRYEDEMICTMKAAIPPDMDLGQLLRAHLEIMKAMAVIPAAEVSINLIIGSCLVEKELLWCIERHA
jgi:uncharacterized protein (DUF2344 family)